jgi:hypothetical protein
MQMPKSTSVRNYKSVVLQIMNQETEMKHLLYKDVNIRICQAMILPVVLHGCKTLVSDMKGGT